MATIMTEDEHSCARRLELNRFNVTWFDATQKPNTYRLELATYIIFMVLLFASMLHRIWAQYYALNDWLRVRSLPMMVLCHMGALILFQISGLFRISGNQLECWFVTIGSLMVVPLIIVPGILKLIWYKTRVLFFEAAMRGVRQAVRDDDDEEKEVIKNGNSPNDRIAEAGGLDAANSTGEAVVERSAASAGTRHAKESFLKNDGSLLARSSRVFASSDRSQNGVSAKTELIRKLNRWKFIASRKGMIYVSCAFFAPFIILTFATFAITDEVYLSRCKGCITNLTHDIFTAAFTAVTIIGASWAIWMMRKSTDPFGILMELRLALCLGALPAFFFFIINFTLGEPTDGWSWSIAMELGVLIYSIVQGSLQVFLSRRQGNKTRKALKARMARHESFFTSGNSLSSLLDTILSKKELHDAFEQYLCTEFAVESLAFIDAVNDFKTGYFDRSTVGRSAFARRIIRSFLADDGTFTINVSALQRDRVREQMEGKAPSEAPPVEIFDECYDEVRKLLELGPLTRFAQTKQFIKLIEPLSSPRRASESERGSFTASVGTGGTLAAPIQ